jgi:hypothetical protein
MIKEFFGFLFLMSFAIVMCTNAVTAEWNLFALMVKTAQYFGVQ